MKIQVQLMLTCLCDAYYGEVGIATVDVLEKLGCEVLFSEGQTCCGQPPFNSGDWEQAKKVAIHCNNIFTKSSSPVVIPSASCTAMVREGYHKLFPDETPFSAFELSEFIVDKLEVTTFNSAKPYPKKVAFHRACHGRSIGLRDHQESLLKTIPGIELLPINQPEQCCGFGGAFCVTHGTLSSTIGLEKLRTLVETGAKEVVTGDMGCAVHMQGLVERHKLDIRFRHYSQILSEVLS